MSSKRVTAALVVGAGGLHFAVAGLSILACSTVLWGLPAMAASRERAATTRREVVTLMRSSLAPIAVEIGQTPVSVIPGGVGMTIEMTPGNCDACKWVETVTGTGDPRGHVVYARGVGSPDDPPPILGNTSGGRGGQEVLWDSPSFPAGRHGSRKFVSTLGMLKGGTFVVFGSITWGFVVSKGRAEVLTASGPNGQVTAANTSAGRGRLASRGGGGAAGGDGVPSLALGRRNSSRLHADLPAGAPAQGRREVDAAILAKWLNEKNYAIRFVYIAPISYNHVPTPTTFRQVERRDPRYGTWTTGFPLGLTQWVSPEAMKGLAEGLAKLNLVWDISSKPMVFRRERIEPPPPPDSLTPPWKLPVPRHKGTMEIDVTCDAGSAVADLPAARICGAMKRVAPAFHSHHAIDAFRDAREEWGCKVSGFRYYNVEPFKPEPGR